VPLDDVAMATRVPRKHLENIEADNYQALPVAVYTRGFVINYAKHLALDAELVAKSYMEKYRKWQEEKGR
jgi:cytoskeletal protein RodZ